MSQEGLASLVESLAECQICCELLYEPTTTCCGHSFCRRCLSLALRHSRKCPSCRTVVASRLPEVNATLQRLIEQLAPATYAARRETLATETANATLPRTLGLFFVDDLLPLQRVKLLVFEQRYRRLMQAVLASTPSTLGIVGWVSPMQMTTVVTEARVDHPSMLADGRYLCEVVGLRRCRILRDWEDDDGYRRAAVEPIVDEPCHDSDRAAELCTEVAAQVGIWCDRVRTGGWERTRSQLDTLLDHLGPVPPLEDAEMFGLWVAALINPTPALGVAPEIRRLVLTQTNTLDRLDTLRQALAQSIDHMAKMRRARPLAALWRARLGDLGRLVVWLVAAVIAQPLELAASLIARRQR